MNINDLKHLLKKNRLKLTSTRLRVLELFLANDRALTVTDFSRLTNDLFDRVSLYRTLKTFEDAGIIHRIIGVSNASSYALSQIRKIVEQPRLDQHLHFSCIQCSSVYCLDDQSVPTVILPDIYEVYSLSMTVIGICRFCNGCKK